MGFFDFVENSNKCANREQLVGYFESSLKSFGIDGFVYSLVRGSFDTNGKIQYGVARSYPEEWVKHYTENNYVEHDPTFRQIIKEKGLFTWKELANMQALTKKENVVMHEAEDAGMKNGMSLSLHGPYGEVLGLGFVSSANNNDLQKDERSVLYAIANQFHLIYKSFDTDPVKLPIKLTDRQKEILQWTAEGKSRSVIAEIMHISESTVDDHFRQLFKKLECNDRIMAVLKAVQLGLITV